MRDPCVGLREKTGWSVSNTAEQFEKKWPARDRPWLGILMLSHTSTKYKG